MSSHPQQEQENQKHNRGLILVNTIALPSLQRLQAAAPVAPRRLHIVFNASWAEPLAISEDLSGYTREIDEEQDAANVLTLAMDTTQPLSATIAVKSLGEYLEPVHLVYELADGTSLVARPSANLCMDFDDFVFSLEPAAARTFVFGPRQYLDALEPLLTSDASPKGPGRRFFSELDRLAEARLREVAVPLGERVATRNHMTGLFYAITGRFGERYGKPTHAHYSQRANVRADVEHVSEMILGLARKHFPDGSGGISLDAFSNAFEMFANGELRLQVPPFDVWSNQPSSGYYFYFAELAFLALECDVATEVWRDLLNVLVRTQEIYCTAYAPAIARADRQLWDYKACNFNESKQVDASEKAALRATYAAFASAATLSVRSGKNAKDFVGAFKA